MGFMMIFFYRNKVTVFNCFGAEWQHWEVQGNKIVNNRNGQCLDIEGNDAYVNGCNGSNNQGWDIQEGK